MQISVMGSLAFRQLLAANQGDGSRPIYFEVEKGTITDILELICRQFGGVIEKMIFDTAKRELKTSVLVLLNGVPHWNLPHRLATELKDGDTIELRPMAAGG